MTAHTGMVDTSGLKSAYAISFGNLPEGTRYNNIEPERKNDGDVRPTLKSHLEERNTYLKALTSTAGGAGTAGYALVPIYVDPRIVDQSRKYTPLTELLPRVSNQGLTADYNVIVSKGGGFVAPEDGPLAETTTTYDRLSVSIKYLYAVGRVTGPVQAAMPAYTNGGFQPSGGSAQIAPFADASSSNAMQQEVLVKARELKELEENILLNGDASTTAAEFSGIIILLGSTNRSNPLSGSGGDIALADIDVAIKDAYDDGGRPNLAVCNSRTFTDIIGLLNAKIGYLQASRVNEWGFSEVILNTMVGPVRLIPSMYLSNTADVGRLIFLDTSVIEVRVLQDMTYQEMAITNDSQKFYLKMYEALVIKAPAFCSQIYTID